MLGGLHSGDRDASVYHELPDRRRESRCRLHEFDLVPQGAVRPEYHLVPGESAAHADRPADEYPTVADPDA